MRLAFFVLLVACHNGPTIDDLVGSACTSDGDCQHRCVMDGDHQFPGGFCTLSCTSDLDCPVDTVCVNPAGGVCMFECARLACPALGPGWNCKSADRHGGDGHVDVCIGG
jgi:hypothetical protein